jgi:hypothetical protein
LVNTVDCKSSNGGSIPPLAYFEFFKNILIKIYEKH